MLETSVQVWTAAQSAQEGLQGLQEKGQDKPASSGTNAINPPHSTLKKKKPTTTSMPPDSQMSSQMLPSLQTGSRTSPCRRPRDKEKAAVATLEKPSSSDKDAKEKHDKCDKHSGKDKKKVHKSKHHKSKK